jgi:hypothetical protein
MNNASDKTIASPVRLPHRLLKEGWWLVDHHHLETSQPAQGAKIMPFLVTERTARADLHEHL